MIAVHPELVPNGWMDMWCVARTLENFLNTNTSYFNLHYLLFLLS